MTDHPHLVPLSTAVAPERERHRHLVDAAVAWRAGQVQRTEPDLFALICAAAQESADGRVSPTRWTRTGVHHLLRCDLPRWCSLRRCRRPDGEVAALWRWFDFLHATGRLDPRSDPLAELRKPLTCAGWLDQDGRSLPGNGPRQVECECFLPYREGALLLGELARAAVDRGEDVLDPLRRALDRSGPPTRWGGGLLDGRSDDGPLRWSGSGP